MPAEIIGSVNYMFRQGEISRYLLTIYYVNFAPGVTGSGKISQRRV